MIRWRFTGIMRSDLLGLNKKWLLSLHAVDFDWNNVFNLWEVDSISTLKSKLYADYDIKMVLHVDFDSNFHYN